MATTLDFLTAKLVAYKNTLDGKSSKEKREHISIQIAAQFNGFLEQIKKEAPESGPHLPQPITWQGIGADHFQIADISFLDLEMLVNQVLAVLNVIRGG